jgi:chaperonin GroES
MTSTLDPLNGHVILKPIEEQEQMAGNIIIPDMGKERPEIAEVVAVDSTFNWHTGQLVSEPKLYPGVKVIVPKMSSQRISIDNQEYYITKVTEILSRIVDTPVARQETLKQLLTETPVLPENDIETPLTALNSTL